MAGFDHHAAAPAEEAAEQTSARSTRYGRMLFVGYALLYAGFVYLNAFRPDVMQKLPLGGINLAVLYGLGLILVAFVLALFYDWLCRLLATPEKTDNEVRS
jgi:uncharacterized membrane protein (DUF485 family)